MTRRPAGVPLAERRRPDPDAALERDAVPPGGAHGPVRHCWVADAIDGRGEKRPGLLLEWRRCGSGWEGRVVYGTPLRGSQWALVEEWLPADALTPR